MEELPAPAADKSPGWVFHPLPTPTPHLPAAAHSLALQINTGSFQPSGSFCQPCPPLSLTCLGRTSGLAALPPCQRAMWLSARLPPQLAPGPCQPASAPLHRGSPASLASQLDPSYCPLPSRLTAWLSPRGRCFSIFSELF